MAARTCAEYMEQQRSIGRYNISYDEIWDAAIKLVDENGSSHNSESAPCEAADSCPVHRCRECKRYYDDMYQLT
jgi:hypothetical protein